MKKFFLLLFFISAIWSVPAISEDIEIDSEVISVNPANEFFVIAAGEEEGTEIGDGVLVHREGEKIAEAYIIEVRPEVSAAEILNVENGKEILKGDAVILVKKIEKGQQKPPQPQIAARPAAAITEQGDIISIGIKRDPKSVFTYVAFVLRENGYSIISSNRATGVILANKPIELSLLKELWADAFAAIDHHLVVSIAIKDEDGYSRLIVSSFREHSQKNRHVRRVVVKNSKYYSELTDLIYKIKERSEY